MDELKIIYLNSVYIKKVLFHNILIHLKNLIIYIA